MKLHITNTNTEEYQQNACLQCGGSGYGDEDEFERNKLVKCLSCHGTGFEPVR